ncbi:MAG: formate dehydrogenase subunit gamma [Pseudomonadota bacterium]
MHRRLALSVAILSLVLAVLALTGSLVQTGLVINEAMAQSSVRPPENAVTNAPAQPGVTRARDAVEGGNILPAGTEGANSLSTIWGEMRHGVEGTVSIPDPMAARLVQDGGMGWLELRAKGGPLQVYGGYALVGVLALLALFYLVRGRVRISHGPTDQRIERFKSVERFAHWLLAVSFILLAVTGLNLLYGKDWILPLIGKESFALATNAGKWVHNNVAWAFMLAIVMVFFMWVRHNLPSLLDLRWFAQGGGLVGLGHPPARKFNAGQKLIFWSVILLGGSISASGISLLFPYEAPMFAKTFVILNDVGISQLVMGAPLATELTPIEEMQYAQIWHTVVAFAMIFIILAHIYIGSVGMEGAFDAMGSGQVDLNWAREHHGLWVDEEQEKAQGSKGLAATPAE